MKTEKSCGAVVFTRIGGELRFVLVRQIKGFYGFPKGHMEGNETERETALREIREEVGLTPALLDGFRMQDEYWIGETRDILKTSVYYLAEYSDQTIVPQPEEITQAELVPYERAIQLLSYDSAKQILAAANDFIQNLNA